MAFEEFNEYFDGVENSEGSLFTCWSELGGGCYTLHDSLAETSMCFIVGKSQIFEVMEANIYKHWSTYVNDWEVIILMENEAPEFELSDEETNYLVEVEII
jgi:hypothetical protein|tara:strand:+ start:446 stop:748 length:303 start_codon:yes stop_codon:yes gene_type:complete